MSECEVPPPAVDIDWCLIAATLAVRGMTKDQKERLLAGDIPRPDQTEFYGPGTEPCRLVLSRLDRHVRVLTDIRKDPALLVRDERLAEVLGDFDAGMRLLRQAVENLRDLHQGEGKN